MSERRYDSEGFYDEGSLPQQPLRPLVSPLPPRGASAVSHSSHPEDFLRSKRMIWLLAVLVAMLVAPSVVERIQYAASYGKARAIKDVALEGLDALDLQNVSIASRWVANAVGASVVDIRTARTVEGPTGLLSESQFTPRRFRMGGEPQWQSLGEGSGVIVDQAGYIVTNNHVVQDATEITVQLADGRSFRGRLVGGDPLTDLAVVKINADGLLAAPWGDSNEVQTGDLVWAVGSPFGLDNTVTFGIVSAKGRKRVTNSLFQDFLQTDAAVNPGNSGGPLINVRGEIVGINTAIVGDSYQGVSFSIPSQIARDVYERIKEYGRISRGYLGVVMAEVNQQVVDTLGLENDLGVRVESVERGSPADRAGVRRNDVIIAWNGEASIDSFTLGRMIAATQIGSQAELTVIRAGRELTLRVTVGERPE